MSHDPTGPGHPDATGAAEVASTAHSPMDALLAGEVREVLRERFYQPSGRAARRPRPAPARPKPAHYKTICISMYTDDLGRLDAKVAELKQAGHRKMNRSALIRFALDQVDLSKLPRSY